MNPDQREIAPVAPELFVPDVAAAVAFYAEKFGFATVRAEADFAIVALGRAVVMFAADHLYVAMGGSVEGARGLAIDVRVMVPDVDAMHRRCHEGGVEIVHDIANRYYGLRDFVARDPNGFRIRFAAPLGA